MSSPKKSTLQSKFLASLSDEERARIFALTSELSGELGKWVARYPLMRPVRVPQLSLTLAATAPFLDVSALLPAARMSMWFFAVDDLFDEGKEPWASLEPRLARCPPLLKDSKPVDPGSDPLLESLGDIRDELARFPLFETLRPLLVLHLCGVLRSMRREQKWAQRSERPSLSFSRYLSHCGVHSIGFFPVYLCLLTTMGDASVRAHLRRLMRLGREAAISLRLANDLRSHDREVAEGKFNALDILQHEFMDKGMDAETALAKVRVTLKEQVLPLRLELCLELGRNERTESARPERYVTDLMSFVCDYYAHHDYHHPLTRQDGNDLDARSSSDS